MTMRWFVITSVTLNIVLSNLCMMPMAYAHLAPQTVAGAIEMAMTPSIPMTPADCEGCVRMSARLSESVFPAGPIHCESGHCLEQGTQVVGVSFASGQAGDQMSAPSTESVQLSAVSGFALSEAHDPPATIAFTSITVLRL